MQGDICVCALKADGAVQIKLRDQCNRYKQGVKGRHDTEREVGKCCLGYVLNNRDGSVIQAG
jgi:hypothetical protein